ncbi:LuxR C-terminal-related transcriptional regulator [Hyunsoonleella rubra]|uniref:LuxR C-terminal-related transcriptional regulator n=1 Tax=Hyunsoonleella rubra TaxID=1737062 RepID=A0ABW5TCC1_9FLAO
MRKAHIKKVFDVWGAVMQNIEPADSKLVLEIVDNIASMFAAGNFYYYVLNFATYKIDYVSEGTQTVLGIPPSQFTLEKIFTLFHPEDLADLHRKERASVNFKMRKIDAKDITKYKSVYLFRFMAADGTYKTILHQSKAINVSKDGKVQQVIGVHTDVTHLDLPIDHKVSFIGDRLPNYHYNEAKDSFDLIEENKIPFTNRELGILKAIVKGNSTNSIASQLNISTNTIYTHKKNILKKSGCKNTSEVIAKCLREGII